jgi:hypothetical protein
MHMIPLLFMIMTTVLEMFGHHFSSDFLEVDANIFVKV